MQGVGERVGRNRCAEIFHGLSGNSTFFLREEKIKSKPGREMEENKGSICSLQVNGYGLASECVAAMKGMTGNGFGFQNVRV